MRLVDYIKKDSIRVFFSKLGFNFHKKNRTLKLIVRIFVLLHQFNFIVIFIVYYNITEEGVLKPLPSHVKLSSFLLMCVV